MESLPSRRTAEAAARWTIRRAVRNRVPLGTDRGRSAGNRALPTRRTGLANGRVRARAGLRCPMCTAP